MKGLSRVGVELIYHIISYIVVILLYPRKPTVASHTSQGFQILE